MSQDDYEMRIGDLEDEILVLESTTKMLVKDLQVLGKSWYDNENTLKYLTELIKDFVRDKCRRHDYPYGCIENYQQIFEQYVEDYEALNLKPKAEIVKS